MKYETVLFFFFKGMLHRLKRVTSLSLIFSTMLSMMMRTIVWRTRCSLSPSRLPRDSHLLSPSAAALRWERFPLHQSTSFRSGSFRLFKLFTVFPVDRFKKEGESSSQPITLLHLTQTHPERTSWCGWSAHRSMVSLRTQNKVNLLAVSLCNMS